MRWVAIATVVVGACGGAAGDVDAPVGPCGPNGPISEGNCANGAYLTCQGSMAETAIQAELTGTSCLTCTPVGQEQHMVTCASGCAVQQVLYYQPLDRFIPDPQVLCAETPEAKAGDTCPTGPAACMPTRAKLAADGTVSGQDYLACVSGVCVAAPPPTIAGYLQRCSDSDLYYWGKPGAFGVLYEGSTSCLLVWDDAANAITSGNTIMCVGDWECPAGSLCDDQIIDVQHFGTRQGVCKPGPKGTLTAAMLSP